jgi:hypothetical protein
VTRPFHFLKIITRLSDRFMQFNLQTRKVKVKVKVKCSRYRPSCGPDGGLRYSSTLP